MRRVGLIVTVLVAALTLGACGSSGNGDEAAAHNQQAQDQQAQDQQAQDQQAQDQPGSDAARGDDKVSVGGAGLDGANGDGLEPVALGDGSATSVQALHRYGEVVDPSAGTGSWSSMEEFLEFVLYDANGYWQSVFSDYGMWSPYVEFVFPAPGESFSTSCGATNDRSAFYCPTDDLIVFSQQMAADLWDGTFELNGRQVPGGGGDMAPAFIVAHEFAHSLQGELGFLDGQFTTLQTELHADCWAGVWAASAESAGMFDDGDIEESLLAAWVIGDTNRADRTHGTPEERIDAFFTGFDSGQPLMCGGYLGFD
jgi:predicted metalloprotease